MEILLLLAAMLVPGQITQSETTYKINLNAPIQKGLSWQYRGDLMERVAAKRGLGWVAGIKGFVSVPDCRHIGQLVYAQIGPARGWWRVVDCSKKKDLKAQQAHSLIIEASGKRALIDGWDHYVLDGPGHVRAAIYGFKEVTRR